MSITHEQAAEMQSRVKYLAKAHNAYNEKPPTTREQNRDFAEFLESAETRQNSPHVERIPKTATTIGGKAERGAGAATAQPKRKKNTEYNIQKDFVQRMGQKYPNILVFSDAAAHVAKSMIQQVRANALQSKGMKWPDCFIAQPSGDYAGLFLEFKAESPYLVSNPCQLKKSDHVEAQYQTMKRLSERGYDWAFVWSVEQAIEITEKYLNQ